jgi:hypothetical protein
MSDSNEARRRQQRTRNLALLAVLVALVVLFYAITIAKMSG